MTVTAYDQLGRVASVTDPLGHTSTYQYDNLGRKTAVVAPYLDPATKITLSDGSVSLLPSPPSSNWTTVTGGGLGGANHYTATGPTKTATWSFQNIAARQVLRGPRHLGPRPRQHEGCPVHRL